jgi:predicted enzyme related to lactoylglutathione lyase
MSNSVNYFEIGTPEPAASKAFYSGMFDWPVGPPSEAGYSMVSGEQGGLWDTSSMGGGNWAIFYVQVDDVAASIAKAVGLGASVAVPLVDNGAIEFAHLVDPQGNRFGVWRPKTV